MHGRPASLAAVAAMNVALAVPAFAKIEDNPTLLRQMGSAKVAP